MKISEIRPCDNCGGKIAPLFYVVRYSIAVFDQQAVRETMGLNMMFGGALGLAEAMTSRPDVATVAMDDPEFKGLKSELFLCNDCYCKNINLAILAQKRTKVEEDSK